MLTCMLAGTFTTAAHAQDAALDDKLRDMLRQTTTQLRAAEDGTATLQASLDQMTRQRDALQQQLAEAKAAPAAPAVTPQMQTAMQQAKAEAAAARAQSSAAAAATAKWQSAYQQAASIARDKDASDKRNAALLAHALAVDTTCKAANTRLIAEAEDILHLYETPKFNMLLIANHERLIGFKRVELENLVQDYDDKINADTYVPPR